MNPLVTGALISGGSGLLGGLVSNRANRRESQRQYERQKEFAQHGIRWRVEDAKAAGLHPLYALGAQTPTYSPVQVQDSVGPALSEAGQDVSRAIQAQQTPQERTMARLAMLKVLSDIKEGDARADYFASAAARERQSAGGSSPLPSTVVAEADVPEHPLQGQVEVKPSEVPTHRLNEPGITAGLPPGMTEYQLPGGRRILLPAGGSMSEAVESVSESWVTMAAVVWMNAQYYGSSQDEAEKALSEALARTGGKAVGKPRSPVQGRFNPRRTW